MTSNITLLSELVLNLHKQQKNLLKEYKKRNIVGLLAEMVLQQGMNYEIVVLPRINKINIEYKDIDDIDCIELKFESVKNLLNINNTRKIRTFIELVFFLKNSNVVTFEDFKNYLSNENSILELKNIHGIGDKSIHYAMNLCGLNQIAIDRHLIEFLKLFGIYTKKYNEAYDKYCYISEITEIDLFEIDKLIWNFMKNFKNNIKFIN